jgi:hypothetical protein
MLEKMRDAKAAEGREMTKFQLAIERLLAEEAAGISITPCLGTGNQEWEIELDYQFKAIYSIKGRVEEIQFIAPGMKAGSPDTSVTAFLSTKRSEEDIYNECRRAYSAAMAWCEKEPDYIPVDVDLSELENDDGAILLTKKSSSATLEQQCASVDPVKYPPDKPFDINELFTPDEPFEILEPSDEDFDIDVDEVDDADFHLPRIDADPVSLEPKEVVLTDQELVEIIDEIDLETGLRRRNLANEEIVSLNAPVAACLSGNLDTLRSMEEYDHLFIITQKYVVDAGPKGVLMRYTDVPERPLEEADEQVLMDLLYKIVDLRNIPEDKKYKMEQHFERGMAKMGRKFPKMLQFLYENEGDILVYSDAISPVNVVNEIFPNQGVVAIYSNDASMVREIASCIMKNDQDKELSMQGIDRKACSLDSGEVKVQFIGHVSRKAFAQYAAGVREQFNELSRKVLEGNDDGQYDAHGARAREEVLPFEKLGLGYYDDEFESVPTVPDVKKMAGIAPDDEERLIQSKIQDGVRRHLRLIYSAGMKKANGE